MAAAQRRRRNGLKNPGVIGLPSYYQARAKRTRVCPFREFCSHVRLIFPTQHKMVVQASRKEEREEMLNNIHVDMRSRGNRLSDFPPSTPFSQLHCNQSIPPATRISKMPVIPNTVENRRFIGPRTNITSNKQTPFMTTHRVCHPPYRDPAMAVTLSVSSKGVHV